jgi:hypothetical protein
MHIERLRVGCGCIGWEVTRFRSNQASGSRPKDAVNVGLKTL